jgi:hypothetical protein
VTGATILLFLRLDLNKEKLLQPLEKRLCCGIEDYDISERRAFEYYTIRVWLKVFPISL